MFHVGPRTLALHIHVVHVVRLIDVRFLVPTRHRPHILNMAILEARVVVGSARSPASRRSNAVETVISSSPYCCMRCRNLSMHNSNSQLVTVPVGAGTARWQRPMHRCASTLEVCALRPMWWICQLEAIVSPQVVLPRCVQSYKALLHM